MDQEQRQCVLSAGSRRFSRPGTERVMHKRSDASSLHPARREQKAPGGNKTFGALHYLHTGIIILECLAACIPILLLGVDFPAMEAVPGSVLWTSSAAANSIWAACFLLITSGLSRTESGCRGQSFPHPQLSLDCLSVELTLTLALAVVSAPKQKRVDRLDCFGPRS